MKRNFYILALIATVLASCNQEPTLQKYYVENSDSKEFVTLDIAPNIINTDSLELSADEKKALESLHKFNVLIYKADSIDKSKYVAEKDKVKNLLKTDQYEELMKVNSADGGFSISTKGEGEHIDEFVVFAHQQESGFGVVRVLGEDMTPTNVMTIAGLLQKANLDMDQLKPLQEMMKKK